METGRQQLLDAEFKAWLLQQDEAHRRKHERAIGEVESKLQQHFPDCNWRLTGTRWWRLNDTATAIITIPGQPVVTSRIFERFLSGVLKLPVVLAGSSGTVLYNGATIVFNNRLEDIKLMHLLGTYYANVPSILPVFRISFPYHFRRN